MRIPEKVWVLGTFSQQDRVCVLAASPATIFPLSSFEASVHVTSASGRITSSGVGRRRPAAPRTGLRLAAVRQSFGATTRRDLDMGAIAEGLVAYTQPLLDQTDGSGNS